MIFPTIGEFTYDVRTIPEALCRKSIFGIVGCKAYRNPLAVHFFVAVGDDFVDSFVAGPNVIIIIAEGFAGVAHAFGCAAFWDTDGSDCFVAVLALVAFLFRLPFAAVIALLRNHADTSARVGGTGNFCTIGIVFVAGARFAPFGFGR